MAHLILVLQSKIVAHRQSQLIKENIKDMLIRQYNNDLPENEYEEKRQMSIEDRKFV